MSRSRLRNATDTPKPNGQFSNTSVCKLVLITIRLGLPLDTHITERVMSIMVQSDHARDLSTRLRARVCNWSVNVRVGIALNLEMYVVAAGQQDFSTGNPRAFLFFFFSSRRRHTRCSRDWSSDVCSSD